MYTPTMTKIAVFIGLAFSGVNAFVSNQQARPNFALYADRRQVLSAVATFPIAVSADTGANVRGVDLNAFNSLTFQYRGGNFGGSAGITDEPSITYADFIASLKSGKVSFVEFLAPSGDVAYATIDNKAIRIGEGYPIEQSDGWSSPAFAVRAVKNAGVPYKFTVPSLASSFKSK